MLKHEDVPQTQPSTAAQVRVTPEELAAAITALQIRKEGQPGTIAIGDAVEELGLDVTPEEVLAEVQARRGQATPLKRRPTLAYRLVLALGLTGIALPIVLELGVALSGSVRPDYSARRIQVDTTGLQVIDATGKQVFLSEIGDNQIFHCRLSGNHLTATIYQRGDPNPAWTMIKHNGGVYVREWGPRVSDKILQTDGIDVINFQNPSNPVPLTLPINGFLAVYSSGAEDESESFYATDVHLDKHAYEKW